MNLTVLKNKLNIKIEDDLLLRILFEMNRFFDKNFTKEIKLYQKKINKIFNQNERNIIRKYYYYNIPCILESIGLSNFPTISFTEEECKNVYSDCLKRLETYNEEKILFSIIERKNNMETGIIVNNSGTWLNYYRNKIDKNFSYSLFILTIDQLDFQKNNYNINSYCSLISNLYDELENYRHLVIKIIDKIYDKDGIDVTWKLIYKIGIFCENFISYKGKFFPFKKEKSIENLANFINDRYNTLKGYEISRKFYDSISTGFKYEDCYISESESSIILTYKKITLDTSPVPCPSCMTTIQSGNSFPELFLKSFECKNPNCPDRSKSGRGKRFDEFGTYRYFKLVENNEENKISYDLYEKWRRDIFSDKNNINEMLLKYYAWDKETVAYYNDSIQNAFNRKCLEYKIKPHLNEYTKSFDELPIKKLFTEIYSLEVNTIGKKALQEKTLIINGNSTNELTDLIPEQIGAAITSPPYYNAREYSQWSTLLMYLIDMMKNASAVNKALCKNGYYLYNIGDIVNTDNVYVESNMSKHRLQLGFFSCMLFELVGYNLEGNIIWDKGEVQSKRNSTVNLTSGYVKCINCYEHVFVFKKGNLSNNNNNSSYVTHFSPVIKINSKGENLYKHTAPYPPEMIELLTPYINHNKYVLDPYLGSGTTIKWCKEHNYKCIGYELNKDYYDLCIEKIFK